MNEARSPSRLLHRALRGNAVFSSVSGLSLAAGTAVLTPWLGLPSPWIPAVIGVGLIGFAAYVWRTAVPDRPSPAAVRFIVASDAAWVLGTVLLLALAPTWLSEPGRWAAIAVADLVLVFAVLQALGLRRSGTRGRAS